MLARERRAMLKRRAYRQEVTTLRDNVQSIGWDTDGLDTRCSDLEQAVADVDRDVDSLRSDVEDLQ